MDSVASAIGAAYLFNGIAARAEENLNGEITFALDYAGYKAWVEEQEGGGREGGREGMPPLFSTVQGASDPYNTDMGICLVDCNAPEQMVKEIGAVAFPPPPPPSLPSSLPPSEEEEKKAEEERSQVKKRALAMRGRIRGREGGQGAREGGKEGAISDGL
jgi:hypothetical protein